MSDAILIHGGRVIDPGTGFDETADVLIVDGTVREIDRVGGFKTSGGLKSACQRIDAEGCIVSPGLVDIHVHFREPSPVHRETIASGAASAINGGFTTVCCMPNTNPALDSSAMVELIHQRAAMANSARVFVVGCATKGRKGQELAEIGSMSSAGAVAFSDDGEVVADAGLMQSALRSVAALNRVFMQHCQDPALTRGASMNAGALAVKMGLTGWPAVAEELIIERDVRLNREIGARYHAQHVSSGGSVEIIRQARRAGQPVSGEVSPHHLLLTEEACEGYNTMAKMNPPLRTQRDVDQLKEGVADGTITVLATDHAPHLPENKNTDFASAAFGIVGLDCALPLYVKALIENGVIDWPAMLAMMTINPARLMGLDRVGIGRLEVGGNGDVTVIDPHMEWRIDAKEFASAGRNCPFDGWEVIGRAVATIVGGQMKMERCGARVTV
ncbi:MAG: dihydroorotase [Phycisphaerales bacterium]|nr:dihydroorotase [Phycisphaerales bacterium]